MADLEINRRLKKIIETVYHLTPFEFSSKYNDPKGQKTYNILNEKNGVSNKMLDSILKAYPEINKIWLLTGEGEMLLSSENNLKEISKDSNTYERLIKELEKRIADKEEIIKSLKEQIELLKRLKSIDALRDNSAECADASGFSDK